MRHNQEKKKNSGLFHSFIGSEVQKPDADNKTIHPGAEDVGDGGLRA